MQRYPIQTILESYSEWSWRITKKTKNIQAFFLSLSMVPKLQRGSLVTSFEVPIHTNYYP